VTVAAPACDIADLRQLREILISIEGSMPPLGGVVHAAMVIEDALLRDMDRGQLHRVLAPKMLGALNLHEATRAHALDFFVLYSSATTLFGTQDRPPMSREPRRGGARQRTAQPRSSGHLRRLGADRGCGLSRAQ